MGEIRKAIPGESNFERPGWFEQDGLVTYRCDSCFQHMSLFGYDIGKDGVVTPDIICPNKACGKVHVAVVLTGFDGKYEKKRGEPRIKDEKTKKEKK